MYSSNTFKIFIVLSSFYFIQACEDSSNDKSSFSVSGKAYFIESDLKHELDSEFDIDNILKLKLNSHEEITLKVGKQRTFEFTSSLFDDNTYEVSISKQPIGQFCRLENATGNIENKNVDSIKVLCREYFRGLSGATKLSTSSTHSCAIVYGEVKCWGENRDGQLNIPSFLSNPTQISTGLGTSCAIDDNGVICWGGDGQQLPSVPDSIVNAKEIASGAFASCVIDDKGLICWGTDSYLTNFPKGLTSPHSLVIDKSNACVIDSSYPICWGHNREAVTLPDYLIDVDQIDISQTHGCAVKGDQVTCWGRDISEEQLEDSVVYVPDNLGDISSISVGVALNCVLSGSEAKCWGEEYSGSRDLTHISQTIKQLNFSDFYGCALDDDEVICSGHIPGNEFSY